MTIPDLTSKSRDLAGILEDTQVKIFDISGEILNKRSVLLSEDQLGERLNQLHGYLVLLTKMEKAGIFSFCTNVQTLFPKVT